VGDELPRIKPTPPPIPADRRGSGILVFFDEKPVNVQYEDVRRELRVAHCFRELDDTSHAFDHLIIMLLMLPRSPGRDSAVETIVNLKMEFFGYEDETDGLSGTTNEGTARRGRAPVQGNVQRSADGTLVYRHGQAGQQEECPVRYRDQ
jgi:hypothetical protein